MALVAAATAPVALADHACRRPARLQGRSPVHRGVHRPSDRAGASKWTPRTDDGSTDETLDIVHARLGDGVIGVERSEGGDGTFRLRRQLARKEELAATLGADWYVHLDPDEIRLAPP